MSLSAARPFADRTILVTGGAHRVGGAISRHLGDLGARVVVHYNRSADEAVALAAELPGSVAVAADLGAPDGARRLFDSCAAADRMPDSVVHAAASFLARPLLDTSAVDWDAVQALNLRAFFLLAQEMARRRGTQGGDLVAIGDSAALELWPGYVAHSVAKAALIPLVKVLAKSLAPGFRVNGVIPGPVLPPAGAAAEEIDRMRRRTLLQRLGDPSHVALAVEFLLRCRFATGSWVEVTGGSQLWRGQLAPALPPGVAGETRQQQAAPAARSERERDAREVVDAAPDGAGSEESQGD
jgi:pteridine reductase